MRPVRRTIACWTNGLSRAMQIRHAERNVARLEPVKIWPPRVSAGAEHHQFAKPNGWSAGAASISGDGAQLPGADAAARPKAKLAGGEAEVFW